MELGDQTGNEINNYILYIYILYNYIRLIFVRWLNTGLHWDTHIVLFCWRCKQTAVCYNNFDKTSIDQGLLLQYWLFKVSF